MLSHTMPSLAEIIILLSLSLAAICLLGEAVVFDVWGGSGSFSNTPYAELSVHSKITCAVLCASEENQRCGGFSFDSSSSTCLLYPYKDTTCSTGVDGTSSASVTPGYTQPAVYGRVTPPACPGNSSDPCGCPGFFTRCAGRCVAMLSPARSYSKAEARCAELGARLATPRTQEESDCVSAYSQVAWVGFSGGENLESFTGADGCGPLEYTKWSATYSHRSAEETFANIQGVYWYRDLASEEYHPFCQLPNCYRYDCL